MIKTVEISEQLSNYIEQLQYECNASKDVITFFLNHNMPLTDSFNEYNRRYVEASSKYEMAKQEISDTYAKPIDPNCTWQLDFKTHILTINIPDKE